MMTCARLALSDHLLVRQTARSLGGTRWMTIERQSGRSNLILSDLPLA